MSEIDNIAKQLKEKYGDGRVPSANEVFAAAYDPETKSLNISLDGSDGGDIIPKEAPELLAEGASAATIRLKVNELITTLKEAGIFF